jgi:exodeoxyribonuclease V gamma subunit
VLHVHRSERADALVAPLAAVLSSPPDDPFTPDVVAVPTKGVERWLAQRLSHVLGADPGTQSGVCANVAFGSPGRLVASVLSEALDLEPAADPWDHDKLVWTVLDVVDACSTQPWCAVLGRYLGPADDARRRGRRLALARHVAGLFTSYGVQRPRLVTAWAGRRADGEGPDGEGPDGEGPDGEGPDGEGPDGDGAGQPIPDDLSWQPELWRRVRARLGAPSPAERLDSAVAAITDGTALLDLPARLSVFGPTRLPTDQLRVLGALGRDRDVHLWLVHPSPALWDAVAALPPGPRRRHERPSAARHPLLASMARDVVELQVRLATLTSGDAVDAHHPAPAPPGTLLGALQQRLRDDTGDDPGDGGPAPHRLDPADRSVEVHACHGRARQVEVLRELLVGFFAADPTLEPRDVLVMCPDVEAVAPYVAATFGVAADGEQADAVHPGQTLRVRLADRSLRQTNPQLALLGTLLELADGRVTASQVLDLAASPPVRRRFGFDTDDVERLREWAGEAGARWGEDVARRARFGLPTLRQGTWDAALDRILLGAAMAEEGHRFVGPALPLDDVDSTDIELAGRFAELLDRLGDVLTRLDGAGPVAGWLDVLDDALDLLADAPHDQAWQGVQARQVLTDVRVAAREHGELPLRLPDVRALLADRLAGRPTRAGFRTGALTVCSLEPMRAVPHRVVCLLGLDDGVFPRRGSGDGDDVLLRDPCIGERDRRSEDRQLFLDAVVAAGERLVVLHTGADERTGAPRPPAVPVGELLDALDRTARAVDGRPAREHVVVRHPLQPVDERNFAAGALHRAGPFSFDAAAHRAALAGRGDRVGRLPFLGRPLPAPPRPDAIDLDDLVAVLEHPARWFVRTRLGMTLPGDDEDVVDRLPLELDALARWQIGDRLLAARLAGVPRDRATNAEWRRGEVPPRELGRATLAAVGDQVVPVAAAVEPHLVGVPEVVDVTADLPSSATLIGSVAGVHDGAVVRSVFSRLGAKHRLRAWVQVLALATARPDRSWRAVTVGRAGGSRPAATVSVLAAPSAVVAAQRLDELVRLRERALREPLPLPAATAHAYARSRYAGDVEEQALEAARTTWAGSREVDDRYHAVVWGERAPLGDLLGTPDATERSWFPDDGTRLGLLARRVWEPLLHAERVRTG